MSILFRNRTLFLTDIAGWALLPSLAIVIRVGGIEGVGPYVQRVAIFTCWAVLFQFLTMYAGGMYRGAWRYASVQEFSGILGSLAVGGVAAAAAHFGVGQFIPLMDGGERLPRSLPLLNTLFAIVWSFGTRFVLRFAAYVGQRRAGRLGRRRAILLGATPAMTELIRSLAEDPRAPFDPVVVVGLDGPPPDGAYHAGVRLLGEPRDLLPLLRAHHASVVVLSPAEVSPERIRRVWDLARQVEASVQVLPSAEALVHHGWKALRDLAVEDLYLAPYPSSGEGRTRAAYAGRRVLITGAAGPIGSQVARRLCAARVAQLILVDASEEGLSRLQMELESEYPTAEVVPVVTDVRDAIRLEELFSRLAPEVVVHAAALHSLALMEANPEETVLATVGGTFSVVRAAERAGVSRLIHASSDLAADPSCVTGAAKLVAERLVGAVGHRTGRAYVSVRCGGLLGGQLGLSAEIVQGIRHLGAVHLAHPDSRRSVTGAERASAMLLEAALEGAPGNVLLEAVEPVRLVDLAMDLARLERKEPGRDLAIRFRSTAPQAQVVRSIVGPGETAVPVTPTLRRVERAGILPAPGEETIRELLASARGGDRSALRTALGDLVAAPSAIRSSPAQGTPTRVPSSRSSGGSRARSS
jgi:FlaA1/EpsC-like NDP-sugar epimerase